MAPKNATDPSAESMLNGSSRALPGVDFDNKLILAGDKVTTGPHTLEIKRKGSGPVYYNA